MWGEDKKWLLSFWSGQVRRLYADGEGRRGMYWEREESRGGMTEKLQKLRFLSAHLQRPFLWVWTSFCIHNTMFFFFKGTPKCLSVRPHKTKLLPLVISLSRAPTASADFKGSHLLITSSSQSTKEYISKNTVSLGKRTAKPLKVLK